MNMKAVITLSGAHNRASYTPEPPTLANNAIPLESNLHVHCHGVHVTHPQTVDESLPGVIHTALYPLLKNGLHYTHWVIEVRHLNALRYRSIDIIEKNDSNFPIFGGNSFNDADMLTFSCYVWE